MPNIARKAIAATLVLIACQPSTSTAAPYEGQRRTCKTSPTLVWSCRKTYADPSGTYRVDTTLDEPRYKAIQWIGSAVECKASGVGSDGKCAITFSNKSTGTQTWKQGLNLEFSFGIDGIDTFKNTLTTEFSRTWTDEDIITQTLYPRQGYSVQLYSYVWRQPSMASYFGAWVKQSGSYACGTLKLYRCVDYFWRNNHLALQTKYDRTTESQQRISYVTFPNGGSSGLVKESE